MMVVTVMVHENFGLDDSWDDGEDGGGVLWGRLLHVLLLRGGSCICFSRLRRGLELLGPGER